MSNAYLETLSKELKAAGIRGRYARRIRAEICDHLGEDPEAELGSPNELAREFADQLGTSRARRAATEAFGALSLVAALFAAAFLASRAAGVSWPHVQPRYSFLAVVGGGGVVIGVQVAFVAGLLAAIRALHLRGQIVIPRAQAKVMVRRAAVALLGGLAASVGLAVIAFDLQAGVPGWVTTTVLAVAGTAVVLLLVAAPATLAAARLQPTAPGPGGDLFDDLGAVVPAPLKGHPWRFAVCIATAVAIVIAVAGALQSDGYDGIARGLADALACLAGFAVLGRYLGLRA